MSFGDGSKEVVLVYVLGGICIQREQTTKNHKIKGKKGLQNVMDSSKGVSMVSPWTMENKIKSNTRE